VRIGQFVYQSRSLLELIEKTDSGDHPGSVFSRLCQKSRKKVIKKAWNYRIHADIFCANYVVY